MILGKHRREMDAEQAPSGWPSMFKAVRETDSNKVDDCRDDIDTLLVFSGLYSAVLTAFVIESYKNLQQDTQDVIVGLLRQLVAQNFTSGPGFLNSTTPTPSPLPDFEPPLWAIRVNVLWFTSLLLSLASASFGILVKQWLREYLALGYADPRQRLRARQYRNPGLSKWKVFEIAAILPLLLQLSLGLFFLGLCFFTSAVHHRIGNTTTPVVCAWAFLLLITTIAPLFSPRCPFKTTFLKSSLRLGRHYFAPALHSLILLTRWCAVIIWREWLHFAKDYARPHVLAIYAAWSRLFMHYAQIFALFVRHHASRPISFISGCARQFGRFAQWLIIRSIIAVIYEIRDRYNAASVDPATQYPIRFRKHQEKLQREQEWVTLISKDRDTLLEEDQVVKTDEEDVEILLSVDRLMSDDGLLATMLDALQQQANASPEKTIEFLSQVVGNRIGLDLRSRRLTFVPDLRLMSKFAWDITINAIATVFLQHSPSSLNVGGSYSVINAVTILVSHSPYTFPEDAIRAAIHAFVPHATPEHRCIFGVTSGQRLTSGDTFPGAPHPELARRIFSKRGPETSMCLRCITDVYTIFLCYGTQNPPPSLHHLLGGRLVAGFATTIERVVWDLFDIVLPFLLQARSNCEEVRGWYETSHLVLQYAAVFNRPKDAWSLCGHMLTTESTTYVILTLFAALHPQCRVTATGADALEYAWCYDLDATKQRKALSCSTSVLKRLCNGDYDSRNHVQLDCVRLCRIYIDIFNSLVPWDEDGSYAQAWRMFWITLAETITRYHERSGWEERLVCEYWHVQETPLALQELLTGDETMACECLSTMYSGSLVGTPEAHDSNSGSSIPIELVAALWLFVPEERAQEFEHLRSIPLHIPRVGSLQGGGVESDITEGATGEGCELERGTSDECVESFHNAGQGTLTEDLDDISGIESVEDVLTM